MSVLRANVEFAKRIGHDRVGNDYVYGGNWRPDDTSVGTDCSGCVIDICDAVRNGTAMSWSRHGMSTETWRPIDVGQTGTIFNTVCVAHPNDFPADAVVKIAIHHGPGGGANSHMWCEVDGVRFESNGSDGCVTGNRARSVYDTNYANDWHYIPGPISGVAPAPTVLTVPLIRNTNGTWTSSSPAWAHLILRESGGNPTIIQQIHDVNSGGNEAEGLFQITPATWRAHNGDQFAASPRQATPEQQAIVAARIFTRNPTGSDWGAGLAGREDANQLAAGLVPITTTTDPLEDLLMSDPVESLSLYATPGEPTIPIVRILQNIDAAEHRKLVEADARYGDPDALARIIRVAAGQGKYKTVGAINHAKAVLADIEATNPAVLKNYLAAKGQ